MKRYILTWLAACTLALHAQEAYKMAGPYEVIARDGKYAKTKIGSERDMSAALKMAKEGNPQALDIINAYANTLRSLEGHDAPLCLIQGYDLVRAMTLLKDKKTDAWEAMVRKAFLPTIDKFEADSPYANGNWGAIVNRMRMACAIFLQDSLLFQSSIDYFLHANDNGSLPKYVGPSGQCQETGRDQGHTQLGLEALAHTCEMAWEQGTDLWGALDNRLMKGFEYTAQYNLGYDVPFETWTDCTGLYNDWTEPGAMNRGKLWDIYKLPYKHYVGRKGLSMPYSKKVLDMQRKGKSPKIKEYKKLHQAITYPAPHGAPLMHDYDVFVRPRGVNDWKKIDTYNARVNAPIGEQKHKVCDISYAFFDFTGDVYVKVVCKRKKFRNARIRPDYRGTIANVVNDSTVQFLFFQPENVSVEFDGNITDNLLLFTSKPPVSSDEAQHEAKFQGRDFVYFAPGFYTQDSIAVRSNTTYYLAGGSYFTGNFAINDAENVSIIGRGIARPGRGYEGCHIYRSQHILVDGLIVNTCPIGESHHVQLHDVRSISFPSWGDGLNVFGGSSDILYDRVFCRNSDDCTTVYATRKGFKGSVSDVTMKNSTLWADVAHPIMIGLHGMGSLSEKSDTIQRLRYENLDILCQSEPQIDYQGCLAINCGDNNVVKDVVFENVRIENINQGSMFHIKTCYNKKYCSAAGLSVEDISFRNIRYYGETYNLSIIAGYDAEHKVKNITFEGIKINGRPIYDDMPGKPRWYQTADYLPAYVGPHVENLRFIK